MKPLAIDLFCGLGGWTEGLLAEGYEAIGFDNEKHEYGDKRYPAQLVLQDVLTLHGRQFKDAALIVASPPCQAYSYRAMPWKKAKALPPPDNSLFEACFRIQREACEAAGHHIPLVVENVRGAIPWVGRSRWNFGSFHLWGDVPALMPMATSRKVPGFRFDGSGKSFQSAAVEHTGIKAPGMNWSDPTKRGQDFTRLAGKHAVDRNTGTKIGGDWFSDPQSTCRRHGSKSKGRKMASAMIAMIPITLSRHIAATYYPR
jgi:C-5 cytosine-specific DNA methylase